MGDEGQRTTDRSVAPQRATQPPRPPDPVVEIMMRGVTAAVEALIRLDVIRVDVEAHAIRGLTSTGKENFNHEVDRILGLTP